MHPEITWSDFEKVDLRVGTILPTGFYDINQAVILAAPQKPIPNGSKLL